MGQYTDADWYRQSVADYTAQYGTVPPPWVIAADSHPYSMRWRMGGGETFMMVFQEWWEQQAWQERERVAYFLKWPPPPRWIPWMADVIWDLEPWDEDGEFDYTRYYAQLEQLGLGGTADVEADMEDSRWD
ncbi:hypothetical protein BLA39750_00205 [Burkholderia lata]|uniref:Uncharacterized protein n=1 Tax=Burkholderia lata (strain ATCC 17760 / DSM 23089 / LMG 22485 / NCIMB 9086 / R18194 / 383) TaxID=482957 RepID=A0A6P2TR63_BURL3|nr:hypothetical protein [Burkholderia lata]VWC66450.1 hypothetical protein BLA39750_00205 [Burkholderia lata]